MVFDFTKHVFCVITGGSRGIGQKIAEEFARKANSITFLLIARSETGLSETKSVIENVNPKAVVFCESLDLSQPNAENFKQLFNKLYKPNLYESAVIFHNAGQIGTIDKIIQLQDENIWQKYYNLNMFSVTVLNSIFLQNIKDISDIYVVNITSLVGRKAFKYLSMYGSGKAARDMYFKVLALEEPLVTVLNYSPGMVNTSMANELVDNIQNYQDSEIYTATKENPTKLTPEETTLKLISILEMGKFTSGDIIDYYD